MGGLMWSKISASEWESVKNNNLWELQENDILPGLKLSYDNLLPHMKCCFTYCCLFPKGYEMEKDLLIDLWIANGFLPPRGESDLYVIGEEIFNCLVSRSFLQDVESNRYHSMDFVCKMHDLMHDLARYVMRYDCSIINPGKELTISLDQVLLHFSSSCSEFFFLDHHSKRLRSLRSIFIFVDKYKGNISQISKHVHLRVLRLDRIEVSRLPESICELKHLRYLSISASKIASLPESIIYLQNLQVLVLRRCWKLRKLPEGLRYMKNLRCLDNESCSNLKCMPVGLKELTCLQRLGRFVVGKNKGSKIRELRELNLLGSSLSLNGLTNVGGLEDAKSAHLKYKTNLLSLVLCWPKELPDRFDLWEKTSVDQPHHENVLEGLEPSSSLKLLEIEGYMGKILSPSWIMNLVNLVEITFEGCEYCERLPSLANFRSLKVIYLKDMDSLKKFEDDEFPNLEKLRVIDCEELVSLPNNLPKLTTLQIVSCHLVTLLPDGIKELTSLRISGNPALTTRNQFYIDK